MNENEKENQQGDRDKVNAPKSQDAKEPRGATPDREGEEQNPAANTPPGFQKLGLAAIGLRLPRRKNLIAGSIVATAVATVAYAAVTVCQLAALKASVEISKRAAEAAE